MQGTGELTKVEGGAFALDGAGVGVDVQGRLAAAGIADLGSKGEMLFVGALDGFDRRSGWASLIAFRTWLKLSGSASS